MKINYLNMREKIINLLLQVRKEDNSKRRRELKIKGSILSKKVVNTPS